MIAVFGGGEIAEKGILPVVGGVAIGAVQCDVRRYAEVDAHMRGTAFSAVVYTAGMSRPVEIGRGSVGDWRMELETNLLGAYHVAQAAVHHQLGVPMVFVASLAGLYGKPNHSGYSASKAGLISLVQSLAMEGHNAYAISPGRVNTAMRERDYPGEDPRTRLDPLVIGGIVQDILAGKYTPGDNIVVRMRGHEVLPLEIHRGDGWRERLRVGEPVTC